MDPIDDRNPSFVTGALRKAPTCIPGLDDILEGGLPVGRTTLVMGDSGSGKTVLGLEFLYRGALAGEPGIFVGFEESVEQIRQNAATLGWDLAALERENRLFVFDGQPDPDMVISGDFSLKGLLAAIAGKSREMGAKRIVIDALDVVLRLFDTPRQARNEIHSLNSWLHNSGLTTILTVRPAMPGESSHFGYFFQSMSDCLIQMEVRTESQISTRRLRVVKYRGSSFGRNEYPYVITPTGLHTAPISTVALRHKPLGRKISTGNAQLDEMLDGGYRDASCVLLAGAPGTGKTTLASTFAQAACARGEKVLTIGFEESVEAVVGNMQSVGIQLRPQIEAGRLDFLTAFPEAMGAEEHFIRAKLKIDAFAPDHVIIDAISATGRMGGKLAAFEYLMRLLTYCKEKGITVLLVNQTSGSAHEIEISGHDISSLIDTVIFLIYREEPGETNRLIQVLKARGSRHSNQRREYRITDSGIVIMDIYVGDGEVLTGTARQVQEAADQAAARRLAFDIETKELELKRLRLEQEQIADGIDRRAAMRGGHAAGAGPAPPARAVPRKEE